VFTNGVTNLQALREIFLINERAQFEWIVSQGSLVEARDKGDPGHMQWLWDIVDHAKVCLEGDISTAQSSPPVWPSPSLAISARRISGCCGTPSSSAVKPS
jgi:hypothetical protein